MTMTIDEIIANEKDRAEKNRNLANNFEDAHNKSMCMKYTKEHEQIVELLEELKALRIWKDDVMEDFCKVDCGSVDEIYQCGQRRGYNKAIDDFTEKLKAKEEELFEPDYGGMCDSSYERSFNNGILALDEAIDEIAEQLKAGGKNDN